MILITEYKHEKTNLLVKLSRFVSFIKKLGSDKIILYKCIILIEIL